MYGVRTFLCIWQELTFMSQQLIWFLIFYNFSQMDRRCYFEKSNRQEMRWTDEKMKFIVDNN